MYDFPTRRKTSITHHKQMLVHKNYKIENKYVCVYTCMHTNVKLHTNTQLRLHVHMYVHKPKQWTMILAKAAALMAKTGGEQGVGRC